MRGCPPWCRKILPALLLLPFLMCGKTVVAEKPRPAQRKLLPAQNAFRVAQAPADDAVEKPAAEEAEAPPPPPAEANKPTAREKKKPPRPPAGISAKDHPWDGGNRIDLTITLSPDDRPGSKAVAYYEVSVAGEYGGAYRVIGSVSPKKKDYARGEVHFEADKLERNEPYFFRVRAVGPDGAKSPPAETSKAVRPTRELFDSGRGWMGLITVILCGSVMFYIYHARRGRDLKIRKIAGLEAVDEAVGRATEMGRSCLFVPGILDMNDIQTIAGMSILSRVAQVAAEYGAKVEVPTCRSLVMTTARETVQAAFLAAGRPDAYNEDDIYYVTDEQFGYVAYLSGMMVREKPAACFYMGAFYAESLILAETGNAIGAIQVAGTAQPAQLPFFVAACDYTLIGEEFFAASAYLSGDPDQLGSLKGQDVGKLIVGVLMVLGSLAWTVTSITGSAWFETISTYLRETVLKAG